MNIMGERKIMAAGKRQRGGRASHKRARMQTEEVKSAHCAVLCRALAMRKVDGCDEQRGDIAGSPAPNSAATVPSSAPDPFSLRLFDPIALDHAIASLAGAGNGVAADDPDASWGEQRTSDEADLSTEERLRLKRLRALARDRRGPWRPLIRATPAMLDRLSAVRARAAHFAPVIDLVSRAAALAMATDSPLSLPPILLLGEPGIGKTWIMKQLAAAIGSTASVLPMNITDAFRLRGLNTAWRGARPGRIAEMLLASDSGSPVILLDEVEKTPSLDRIERPFDIWHSLWERENAISFTDDYYELPLRCDRVLWIASANSLDPLPSSIVDRLLIIPIPPPDAEQLGVIIDGLYATARKQLGDILNEALGVTVRAALARHSPRRIKRVLELAMGFMAAEHRTALTAADVERAADMTAGAQRYGTFRHPIGFSPPMST